MSKISLEAYQKYYQGIQTSEYPIGTNCVIEFNNLKSGICLPGFVNCPAIVGFTANTIGLLHYHFELKLSDFSQFNLWKEMYQDPYVIWCLGTTTSRLSEAEIELRKRFPQTNLKFAEKLKLKSLVADLLINKEDNLITMTLQDHFYIENQISVIQEV